MKQIIKPYLFLIGYFIFPFLPVAGQSTITILSGLNVDANNNARFKQIGFGIQFFPREGNQGSFFIQLDAGLPLTNKSSDSAFTLRAGFPPAIETQKEIQWSGFSLSLGYRFFIHKKSDSYFFADLLATGYHPFRYKVNYPNYDSENYEILNPDIAGRGSGIAMGIGFGYHWKKWVIQTQIQTPPLRFDLKSDYEQSFKPTDAPWKIQFGYNLSFKKKKNE